MSERKEALAELWEVIDHRLGKEWADELIEYCREKPNEYGSDIGPALERLFACGVNRDDLDIILRCDRYETVFTTLTTLAQYDMLSEAGDGLYEELLEADPKR